jgi:hypothetical protein
MQKPIIIKNTLNEVVHITDMDNQYIAELDAFELSDYYSISDINGSQSLKDLITDGTFIINDGTNDLSIADALEHTKDVTNYEMIKNLVDLPEVSPIEAGKLLQGVDSTSTTWVDMPSGGFGGSGGNLVSFSYSGKTHSPGLKCDKTSWTVMASFIYDGTTLSGTPENFKVLAYSKESKTTYVRLYDYTNNNEIAQLTVNSATRQIWITGTISNLPTGRAIFEIHGKTTESRKNLYIQAAAMGV